MITSLTIAFFNGAMRLVEDIRYNSGKRVLRILDPHTQIPTDIVDVHGDIYSANGRISKNLGSVLS